MKPIRFQSGYITDENVAGSENSEGRLSKKALLVYEGTFQSMDGEVTLTADDIKTIGDNHNSMMAKLTRMFKGGGAKTQIPVQLDHSPKASDTIGRVEGPVELGSFKDPDDGVDKAALYGTLCFIGKDNVEKAKDGRWTHLSIGLEKESKLTEVSVTPFPAAPHASLLSKKLGTGELDMGYSEYKKMHEKYAKCKKHLMEHKGLSEEDADKKLSEAKDEDLSRMEKEHDEHLKHLAEEDEGEAKKELAKYKSQVVELKREQEVARLAQRKLSISVRLSKLRAMGKVTPAEIKKIDVVALAKGSDETLETAFKLYDARQPVIPVGQHGTTRASDPAQVAANLKRLKKQQMEQDSMNNMTFTGTALKNMEKARLAANGGGMPGGPSNESHMGTQVPGMPGGPSNVEHMADKPEGAGYEGMEADYDTMHKLMSEGKHEEAHEHFKRMHEKMKAHLAGHGGDEGGHPMEGVEQHMKEVEDSQKALAKRLETVTI